MSKSLKSKFEIAVIDKVREKRIALKYSQEDLGSFLNTSRGFIGQVESPNFPTKYNLNHLDTLAKEFKCSPKDFMPDEPI